MISDLFFGGKLKDADNLIIYEEEFVLLYLTIKLKYYTYFEKEDVERVLVEFYGEKNIKSKKIPEVCEKFFNTYGKQYCFKEEHKENEYYQKSFSFWEEITKNSNIDSALIYSGIENEVLDNNINFENKLKKCLLYYELRNDINVKEEFILIYKYFHILKKHYELYRIIDNRLEKIPEIFDSIEITELSLTEKQLNLLISNNIFSLKNIKQLPVNSLICVFSDDIETFVNEIERYSNSKEEVLDKLSRKFNELIKEDSVSIILRRYALEESKRKTLAEIGDESNLTRERVRQKEKKAISTLMQNSDEISEIIYCFYKDINKQNREFITIEEFLQYIKDEQLTIYLTIIMNSEKTRLVYDEKYGIIYDKREITLEEIIEQEKEDLKDIFPVSEMEKLDKVQKIIIKNEYRIYQEKILVRKGVNSTNIYINEIKENFVDGYNIGSGEDYNKLIDIIKDKYGELEIPVKHGIQAIIDRNNFTQIDNGKYIPREYAVNLPEELTDKILDYIINNDSPIIAYNTIFEKFKNELEKIGVCNRYYLKGLIDEKLPEEFNTGRDHINTNSDNTISLSDVITKIFRGFEAEFTLNDIKEKLPGLKDYTYRNYISAEEKNGLIKMATNTYIYIDKLNITEETKKELKEYIDSLFVTLDSKIITSKKLYASLAIKNKELLKKLHVTARFGDYELYFIIKYLFKNDYYYSRPIISQEEDATVSEYALLQEYVKRLDKFCLEDVKSYLRKMNFRQLYSYLNFMEDMSESFVQINRDSMIKKEKLNLTNEKLKEIHDFVEMIVGKKELRLDNFDGYFMLPKIEKPWNKYLLVGIIRSYFDEEFEVENTTNQYFSTDFIVRRII